MGTAGSRFSGYADLYACLHVGRLWRTALRVTFVPYRGSPNPVLHLPLIRIRAKRRLYNRMSLTDPPRLRKHDNVDRGANASAAASKLFGSRTNTLLLPEMWERTQRSAETSCAKSLFFFF